MEHPMLILAALSS